MSNSKPSPLAIPSCDDKPLWDVMQSGYHFRSMCAADRLGVFAFLAKGPAHIEDIAKHLSLGPRATEALIGVLTSLDMLAQREGKFYLTDVSRNFLLPDSPYYWGGIIDFLGDIPLTTTALIEALQKDKPIGYEGKDLWETHEIDPEQAKVFTRAMQSHSFPAAMGMAHRGNFEGVTRMLDMAGGSGCFDIALALRYPEMRFTVAELPIVCELTKEYVAEHRLGDRIDTMSFDMFSDDWPSGYDAIFFSNIFHDWGWERCKHLAACSFDALPSGGSIYLHEMLLNDTKDGPLTPISFSMNMIFFTEGKQFSAKELRELLEAHGFKNIEIVPTYGYYSLIRGRKP